MFASAGLLRCFSKSSHASPTWPQKADNASSNCDTASANASELSLEVRASLGTCASKPKNRRRPLQSASVADRVRDHWLAAASASLCSRRSCDRASEGPSSSLEGVASSALPSSKLPDDCRRRSHVAASGPSPVLWLPRSSSSISFPHAAGKGPKENLSWFWPCSSEGSFSKWSGEPAGEDGHVDGGTWLSSELALPSSKRSKSCLRSTSGSRVTRKLSYNVCTCGSRLENSLSSWGPNTSIQAFCSPQESHANCQHLPVS
mmetsp:Transcript_60276/g.197125  ORF Transcript_60276/g.197125 Transcript_60276/m.197125 type:complete len:261 (-) Transcript_60276:2787-3569(-)